MTLDELVAAGGFGAVRACALTLLAGVVLRAEGVSAGNGLVVDWRTVKCGEAILTDGDAFDVAYLFVALVGPDPARAAAMRDQYIKPAPAFVAQLRRVSAYARCDNGGRRRSFEAGPFTVYVEPHEEDDAQAAFTAKLAEVAAELA